MSDWAARSDGVDRALRIASGILLALVLVLTNVRLLLTETFVVAEYAGPGFPVDPYGFTQEQRVAYASLALDYLLNDAGTSFLTEQRHGDGTPLYNGRELRHMVDVRNLVQSALRVWLGCAALLAVALWWAWRRQGWPGVRQNLHFGGRLTLILMAVLLIVLVVSFSFLFVGFHRIFFDSGTWVFYRSDTLIRLFPERFWRDAFGLLLGMTLAEAGLILLLTRPRRPSGSAAESIPPTQDRPEGVADAS